MRYLKFGTSLTRRCQEQRRLLDLGSRSCFHSDIFPSGTKAFINGAWVESHSGASFAVTNPATGATLASVPNCDVKDAEAAVVSARKAFQTWGFDTTAKERAALLQKWFNILMKRQDELAQILTAEQGKPLAEAKGEIAYGAGFFDWFAGEARRTYGQIVPAPVANRQHFHYREPSGVVAMITPWNFPTAMITRKTGAALAAGCTVVVKPAEDTPLSALALASTAKEAGIPDGVFNVVTAARQNTAAVGKLWCESPDVDVISFTGSTAVGKILLHQSADRVKRVCLELGGNAPLIVFPSADLDKAVAGTMASKFRGSGQTCVCVNRIFVHSSVYDAYLDKLKSAIVKDLKVGDGSQAGITQGPLINELAVKKVSGLVEDARKKGAKVIVGGARHSAGPSFYEPTLLADIKPQMDIANTEIFGPVAAVVKFDSEEQVIKLANNTRMGLAGYFFSQDVAQIFRVARRLEVGMVGVNEGVMSSAEAAFGGVKESGLGREGASQGMDEFTEWKYVCLGGL
uniref:Succinate-semialdehyde dehydrogenase n=1 Tax=Plectus sambesii TaxID=2011161 RepID=A0A914V615_9BILA